ncbi:hypothetical protein HOK68_02925 [Candidatus Woesearchaeota archaeon]|jgi:hypothetical protein|nr:hypothetical protein [Candidatus Woesearchaeota archaeon]MBT4387860.1 hypothetical protein [Candidatus Woesearchaeota archaeon]MBT4595679.1 hypothetical protein [Candidatus Woesearchaeota archaeon]MBT5740702.1 hypothetical protein [Candidatus Woesearchaeota archaeon]MBT6505706.1 hypothetical protein [Candidatus Woesearchaeota archaeon]
MDPLFVGVIIAFLYIFITHIFANAYIHNFKYETIRSINSFAIGISTSYLVLILIPETLITFDGKIANFSGIAPIVMLLMFTFQFIIHRVLAHQVKKKSIKERVLHLVTASVYHFFLGMLFLTFSKSLNYYELFLFFTPIFIHGAFSHLTRHNKNLLKNNVENNVLVKELKVFNIVAVLAGVFMGSIFNLEFIDISILIAIVAGNYIYSIFLENMVNKEVIKNRWLLGGQVFYILIYVLTRFF